MSNGYLDAGPRRPGALAAVIAVHAAGIGALMMIAPTVADRITKTLIVEQIPLPQSPPEKVEEPAPATKARIVRPVDAIKPVVDSKPAANDPRLATDPGPLSGAGTGNAIGGGFEIVQIDPPRDPVITAARLTTRNVQPPYPASMQRLNIEGAVTVRVLVGADGRPLRIEAVKVDQEAFFEATRDWAMKRWTFAPATRDGEPVEAWRTMTVRFEMN